MTKINYVKAHGFKSFAHKTEIPFDRQFNCILGPNGSGKCVTGDTQVQLADGRLIPIKELIEKKSKNICEEIDDGFIYKGDNTEILCLNTLTYKVESRPIKNYVKRTAPKKLLQIKMRSGREITSTPYHPLFILKEGKIISARADELQEGKKIAVPRQVKVRPTTKIFYEFLDEIKEEDNLYVPWSESLEKALKDRKNGCWTELTKSLQIPKETLHSFFLKQAIKFNYLVKVLRSLNYTDTEIIQQIPSVKAKAGTKIYPFPWKNSPELARLLGYLLAEGRLTASNQIWFTNGTEEIVEDYAELMQYVFSERSSINEYKANCWDVIVYSKPLQIILSKFGLPIAKRTGDKTISASYFSHSSDEELAELLNGLYCGDGYVSKNSIEITTKSKQLASAVQIALTRLGILYQSREVFKMATNSGFSGKYQQINIYGKENFAEFYKHIKLVHPKKFKRTEELLKGVGNPNLDLIDVNALVKRTAQDCRINVKETKKKFAKIDAYCYNQCTPSRQGVQQLITEVFDRSGVSQAQSLVQLQNLAHANVYWDEIVSINEVNPKEKWVYDLCVEQHHNFIAGNIFVHNSNVGDALCFVLGRLSAKSMRAEKAANLIFNGGKSKKPSVAGTVEISFCNKNNIFPADSEEMIVSRTITKNGGSIYRINGKKKTRTEVLDLLSVAKINPDGYNIILQGDIMKFVDMSPMERRKIIEEISDVSLYEEKKHKAMMELNKVEEKLGNAEIILKERKTYLKELKKDRDQALKFKELKDQIDSNKATYLHHQIKDKEENKAKYDQEIGKHQLKIDSAEKKTSDLKSKVSKYKEDIVNINQEIEKKGEKEQVQVHRQIEDLKVSITRDKTRVSTLKDEIGKIQQRKDQLQEEMKEFKEKNVSYSKKQKELEQNISLKKRELQQIESNIAQFKKKHKIESSQELDQDIEHKDKLIEQKTEEIQSIRQQQQELLREKDKVEYQLQSIDERAAKVKEIAQEHKEQIHKLQQQKQDFKAATLRLNVLLDQDSSFAAQMGNARKKLAEAQEKQADLNAKTLSVKAGLQSNYAVKSILESKKKGVHGTISELGQVKKTYATALETSAGGKMQHIVVDDDRVAAECIKYLKSNQLGSASFIPLNKIRSQDIRKEDRELVKKQGVHDFAINLINFRPEYKKAFAYVFGNSLVVDDIDTARNVGIGRIKMSTLDGNIVEGSGVMRGGFRSSKSVLGFKEKDSLEALEKVDAEVSELQGVMCNIESKREANEIEIGELRKKKGELEGEIITLEKTLHLGTDDLDATSEQKKHLSVRLKEVDKELTDVQKGISSINRELADLKSKKQMLRTQVNELRNPRLLAQLSAFDETRQKCKEDLVRLDGDFKNCKMQMEQMIGPEHDKILEIMKQHDKEETEFIEEIKKLTDAFTKSDKELIQKEKASKEFYSKYHALFNKREKMSNEVNQAENEIENVREKVRTNERELNLISLKNAEIKAKLAGLEEEFTRFKDVPLIKNKPIEDLKQEINKFEVMLAQMSAVNMKALEVYEQVEKAYNELVGKKESLVIEKTDVLTLMNEIETKKKEHFMKTFKSANHNFSRIFSSLFNKGKAYLHLENPDKPFEDGLSIKVKLLGNRFMDIKSLSGGEKTLTALSFIFAIQEYQPATFYILDEIDAALDKHNSETLAKLIRNYADKAQYIVISHNDSLIAEADTLFGVSMTDGVSKVTSLKI